MTDGFATCAAVRNNGPGGRVCCGPLAGEASMSRATFTPAQIIKKLERVARLIAKGAPAKTACKRAGITEIKYRRWRKEYCALERRLTRLESDRKTRSRDLTESLAQQMA